MSRLIMQILSTLLAFVLSNFSIAANPPYEEGLTSKELQTFAGAAKNLPGRIQAVEIFHEGKDAKDSIAVATWSSESNWQIELFEPNGSGGYSLAWSSGKLDDEFAVSSYREFGIFDFGNERGVTFEGCAQHVCPDVFAVLLYVPSLKRAFVAKCNSGKVTYIPTVESPDLSQYKRALDLLIDKRNPSE